MFISSTCCFTTGSIGLKYRSACSVRWTKRRGAMKREQKNRKPSPNKTHSSRRQCRHLARTRLHPPYTAKTRSLLSAVRERRVFLERREQEKIKHGEQQQSHLYVSTYINARDFFFLHFLFFTGLPRCVSLSQT